MATLDPFLATFTDGYPGAFSAGTADSAGAGDAAARTAARRAGTSDTAGAADNLGGGNAHAAATSDAAGAAETVSAGRTTTRATSDTTSVTDAAARSQAGTTSLISEALTVSDASRVTQVSVTAPFSEAAGAVDVVVAVGRVHASVADTTHVSDSAFAHRSWSVTFVEVAGPQGFLYPPEYLATYTTDVAINDTLRTQARSGRSTADTVPVPSDHATGLRVTLSYGSDLAPASDSVGYFFQPIHQFRTPTETAPAVDSAAAVGFHVKPPRPGRGTHLRLYDLTMTRLLAVLPDFQSLNVLDELNQPGQMTCDYPMSGTKADVLADADAALVAVMDGGRQVFLGVLDEDSDDPADNSSGEDRLLAITAPGTLTLLSWVRLYPQAGFNTPNYVDFVHLTPGAVLAQVLAAGQARGVLDGVDGPRVVLSFDENVDSAGVPWPSTVWVRYEGGKTMLDVVNDLAAQGYVNVRMNGLVLDCYVAEGTADVATNVFPTPLTTQAQGWTAVSGASVKVTTSVLPSEDVGIAAALQITSTAAAAPTDVNDPNYGIEPILDAVVRTPAYPVEAGVTYVASLDGHADAVPRQVIVRVDWLDGLGAVLSSEAVVPSILDNPGLWASAAGNVTAPAGAVSARFTATLVGLVNAEKHYLAGPRLSVATAGPLRRDLPKIILHRSREVTAAPRQRKRTEIATALLLTGSGNLSTEVTDPDAIARYGRREGYVAQGSANDYTTLLGVGQTTLKEQNRPQESITAEYDREQGGPQPWGDYTPGDYVRADWVRAADSGYEPLRVKSIAASYDSDGVSHASLELNDVLVEADVRLARQVNVLINGSSSATSTPTGPVVIDTVPPWPVAAVYISDTPVLLPDGKIASDMTVSWPQVLFNADLTPFDDLGAYEVSYRVLAGVDPRDGTEIWGGWSGAVSTQNLAVNFALTPGQTVQARVLPVDYNGNFPSLDGDPLYTTSAIVTLAHDDEPPVAPDAPTVASNLGVLHVTWDGLDVAGQPPTPDFSYAEVHVSTLSGFTPSTLLATPSNATLYDTMHASTAANAPLLATAIPGLTYGQTYYVRLVAVDTTGNRSLAGVQSVPVTIAKVGSADLNPSAVTDTDHSLIASADTGYTSGGDLVADAGTYGTFARKGTAGDVLGGVNYAGLRPGRYRATFLLRTDVVTPGTPLAILDATGVGGNVTSDGGRTITTDDMTNPRGYTAVSISFTVNETTQALDLPVTAQANVWLSCTYVEPVQVMGLAEITAAMIGEVDAGTIRSGSMSADLILTGSTGRIRVGGGPDGTAYPRIEMSEAGGIAAYDAGGNQTLFVGTDGTVEVTGSIKAGSDLPSSVYAYNLVVNASMEDPTVGAPGPTVPAHWTDAYETTGGSSSAYADAAAPLGGTASLTIRTDDTASGRAVASKAFPVVAGERLQVGTQFRNTGPLGKVYVRVLFGNKTGFLRSEHVTATTVKPANAQVLNLDGSVVEAAPVAGGAGLADVASNYSPKKAATSYKVTGSVIAPAGASWARLVLYSWARGGTATGSTYMTFDNTYVIRSNDGHTMVASTITGPIIRTADTGVRIEISSFVDPILQIIGGSDLYGASIYFYGDNTSPPVEFQSIDTSTMGGWPAVDWIAPNPNPSLTYQRGRITNAGSQIWLGIETDDLSGGGQVIIGPNSLIFAVDYADYRLRLTRGSFYIGDGSQVIDIHANGDIYAFNLPSSTASAYQHIIASSTGRFYYGPTVGSSRAIKQDVEPAPYDVDALLGLEPLRFRYIDDVERLGDRADRRIGLIGEDLDAVLPDLVIHGGDGEVTDVDYGRIGLLLVPVVRDLRAEVARLRDLVDARL